jgi:hypothetical protein
MVVLLVMWLVRLEVTVMVVLLVMWLVWLEVCELKVSELEDWHYFEQHRPTAYTRSAMLQK